MSLISGIYRHGPGPDLTPQQAAERNAAIRRAIWQATGWAVIALEAVLDDWDRQLINNECVKQNGKRG